jgi:hypothetical protein
MVEVKEVLIPLAVRAPPDPSVNPSTSEDPSVRFKVAPLIFNKPSPLMLRMVTSALEREIV